MELESIEEDEEYNAWSILSTIGGAVSLYLGITLVSLFEFVELLVRIIHAGFKGGPAKKKN